MKRNRKIGSLLMAAVILFLCLPVNAKADTGPKPSVRIDFEGFEGEKYYVTLLSEVESTGPYSVLSETEYTRTENGWITPAEEIIYYYSEEERTAFEKFANYQDPDDFYFLQYLEECSETQQFEWGYYPPDRFKILIYFPEEDYFLTDNQIYERYAFRTYYTVKMQGDELISEKEETQDLLTTVKTDMIMEKAEYYSREMFALGKRMLVTLAVELLVAWCFSFRKIRWLGVITAANVATQLGLNLGLAMLYRCMGSWGTALGYLPLELLIVLVEALWYKKCFGKEGISERKIWGYAFAANGASLVMGIILGFQALEFM